MSVDCCSTIDTCVRYKCKICYLSHICRSSWYAHALRNHLSTPAHIYLHTDFIVDHFFHSLVRIVVAIKAKENEKNLKKHSRAHTYNGWNNAWHTNGQYALFYMHENHHIYNAAISYFSSGKFFFVLLFYEWNCINCVFFCFLVGGPIVPLLQKSVKKALFLLLSECVMCSYIAHGVL